MENILFCAEESSFPNHRKYSTTFGFYFAIYLALGLGNVGYPNP